MKKVIVVAPHPDDESWGCGGTLLRHIAMGDQVSWLIMTEASQKYGYSKERVSSRKMEIEKVALSYGFSFVYQLDYPSKKLDTIPAVDMVESISEIFKKFQPEIVYVPYREDVHTDHKVVFDAVISCSKWFRFKSIRRVLCYETLSETDFDMCPNMMRFCPNVFVDIAAYLEKKMEILKIYTSEISDFPFPRSENSVRALAQLRGSTSGCLAAEAFMLLKEIV